MSRKSEIIAAIDICTAKTVVIIGRKDDQGTVEIISYSKVNSQGVKRGVIYNSEEAVSSVREALTKARKNYSGPISKVFVGINGQHIYSESVDGVKELENARYIRKEDVAELVKGAESVELHPGETIYDVIPQCYRVNNEDSIMNPVGVFGNDIYGEFKLILGPDSYVKNTCYCIEKAGLNLSNICISPLASGDAVLTEDEKEAGVVLVDFGSGITNVSVYYDKILRHVGIIPFGGEVITRDIKEGCSILLRQAEALKVQYGSALGDNAPDDKVVTIPGMPGWEPKEISFKSLAYIIQARIEEIIDSCYFQIEKSGFAEHLGAGIVITGGTAQLQDLMQLIRLKTGFDVRLGKPSINIKGQIPKGIDSPEFSTALGIFMQGLKHAEMEPEVVEEIKEEPISINVIEPEVKAEKAVDAKAESKKAKVKETHKPTPKKERKITVKMRTLLSDFFSEPDQEITNN